MVARKSVPLIVASAIIMQQIDSTALATALPSIAESLHVPAITLHSVITTYLLSLGVFLPLSGWTADRLGARTVFRAAIAIFTAASLLCAVSGSLTVLVLARVLQGFGGAMMLPVGRLILVRSVPRAELVSAMILMSLPAVIGPAVGPLLGGFLTGAFSWRWIFWINLPIGVLGIILVTLLIEEVPGRRDRRFDIVGFALSGFGIGATIFALDSATRDTGSTSVGFAVLGAAALGAYVLYARTIPHPILDLNLFRLPTFRASLLGGSLFRIGFGAMPFMLPLLMQEVFGYSPLESGSITFVSAIGAFGMRTVARRILHRFGFRRVLVYNSLIASGSMALCACFDASAAPIFMMVVIFIGGVFRALQFTSINTLAFAEVTSEETSHATTLSQMAQRLSQSIGVAFAALLLHVFSGEAQHPTNHAFSLAFLIVGSMSAISCASFMALSGTAGDVLAGRLREEA